MQILRLRQGGVKQRGKNLRVADLVAIVSRTVYESNDRPATRGAFRGAARTFIHLSKPSGVNTLCAGDHEGR